MQKAFSLVELSIVLVILGLLTGGILAGQSLIKAAELRAVVTERDRFSSAINVFKEKYLAVPGDMRNAVAFWGQDDVCNHTNQTPAVGTETCNGNGNGAVGQYPFMDGSSDMNAQPGGATETEQFRFWQHLTNAGLIEGKYSGVSMSNIGNRLFYGPGTNCPASKFGRNTCWATGEQNKTNPALYGITLGGFVRDAAYDYSRGTLVLGVPDPSGNSIVQNFAFSPNEAWQIDAKLDDGKPLSGTVLARGAHRCIAGGGPPPPAGTENNYLVAMENIGPYEGCTLYFTNMF